MALVKYTGKHGALGVFVRDQGKDKPCPFGEPVDLSEALAAELVARGEFEPVQKDD